MKASPKLREYVTRRISGSAVEAGITEEEMRAGDMAIALHNIHQRCMSGPANAPGVGLGKALRTLIDKRGEDRSEGPTITRFHGAATLDDVGDFCTGITGIIKMMGHDSIPLDYPELAENLYNFIDYGDQVRLIWARQFAANSAEDGTYGTV